MMTEGRAHPGTRETPAAFRATPPRPSRLDSRRAAGLLVLALALAWGCGDRGPRPPGDPEPQAPQAPETGTASTESSDLRFPAVSADAKVDVYESLKLDLETARDPSDGGGRAWLESVQVADPEGVFHPAEESPEGRPIVPAGGLARFEIVYEAGPLGVAENGVVFLQASPFWDWDTPQPSWPDGSGYTEVTTDAEGVTLAPEVAATQLLAIPIEGRALAAGERLRIVYGAGPLGARVDRYAERESPIWLLVDGDGDGVRGLVVDSPVVDVHARQPVHLIVTLPTTARPGDEVRLDVAVLDAVGNARVDYTGEITLELPDGLELPERIVLEAGDRGHRSVSGRVRRAGIHRVRARASGALEGLEVESNPLVVDPAVQRVLWGDLHGHSALSDGTGTPEDFYDYARNVASLDVAALTDHDHWGMRFLDATPEWWERIRRAAAQAYEPGRFVTMLGYEWTSWLQGHRHILYFGDPLGDDESTPLLSSLDPRYQTPDQLWQALEDHDALTFAHHSAGGPISTNWTFAPPPRLEPVTEIVSVHGSSEAEDSPGRIYDPVPGNYVRDALGLGYRFGFIGSGDSHDGHPGLANIASGAGVTGLAAIRAEACTREAVLEALRARRTYATNGPRIHLDVRLEGDTLHWRIAGTAPIERIDFVRSGMMASVAGEGQRDWEGTREIPPLAPAEYLYLRVVQVNGGTAWSSPFYGTPPEADTGP